MRSEQEVRALERAIEAFQDKETMPNQGRRPQIAGADDESMLDVVRWVLGVDDSSLEQFIKDQDMEV